MLELPGNSRQEGSAKPKDCIAQWGVLGQHRHLKVKFEPLRLSECLKRHTGLVPSYFPFPAPKSKEADLSFSSSKPDLATTPVLSKAWPGAFSFPCFITQEQGDIRQNRRAENSKPILKKHHFRTPWSVKFGMLAGLGWLRFEEGMRHVHGWQILHLTIIAIKGLEQDRKALAWKHQWLHDYDTKQKTRVCRKKVVMPYLLHGSCFLNSKLA